MMASAMMDGLLAKGVCQPSDIICSDMYQPSLNKARSKGVNGTTKNSEVVANAKDAIILAVKPHIISKVCDDIMNASKGGENALIISIAAGVSLETLESSLRSRRVVRVMPNTPCLGTYFTIIRHTFEF